MGQRASLHPGAAIADRYRLVEPLGAGGMGSVWRATHVTLAHDVAIKFLQTQDISTDARARFEREAKLAARLGEASRHITRVIDYGVLASTTPYLVMELLQGETLSDRLRRERKFSLELTAKMVVQLCRALQVAHGAGVIHRDLKPSNIFLARSEFDDEIVVKLMDFGVAKSTEVTEDDEPTGAGTIIGTPGYMSPEQIMGKRLDARTDLWGVGATVYRVLCGRSPFGQGGIPELGLRIIATEPLPPTTLNAALPKALDIWMEKTLAKSPEDRFQSARDLADALALVAGVRDVESGVGAIVPLPDETFPPDRISVAREDPPTRSEGRRKSAPSSRAWPIVWFVAALGIGMGVARSREQGAAAAPPVMSASIPARPAIAMESVTLFVPASAPSPSASKTAPKPPPPKVVVPALEESRKDWERRDQL